MNEAIKPSTWHLPRDKHGPSQPHWARKSARRVGRAHRTPLAWRDCSASEAALEGNAFALHATCLHQIARAHRLSCAAGRGTQRQPNSARARGRGEGELPWACGWRGGAKGMRSGVLGGQEGRIPAPPPRWQQQPMGQKGAARAPGRGARHAGRLGPAWGSHFQPASGPSPAASSCSLRQNLAAPKLRRDHRITDGGGLRSAAKGLARAKSWTASPASEAPRPPGSAPWLAMGRAPALGRAAAPQPNCPANLPTLYGLLGHHKTP